MVKKRKETYYCTHGCVCQLDIKEYDDDDDDDENVARLMNKELLLNLLVMELNLLVIISNTFFLSYTLYCL